MPGVVEEATTTIREPQAMVVQAEWAAEAAVQIILQHIPQQVILQLLAQPTLAEVVAGDTQVDVIQVDEVEAV
jgi:hypothetical protein